jgi:hypothetical protein
LSGYGKLLNFNELTAKHSSDVLLICLIDRGEVSQVAFPLGRLFGQNVAFISMLPFYLTGTGKLEPFLGSGFRLHLRHY